MMQAHGFEFYVTAANAAVGVLGIFPDKCLCGITKAMLAGISHRVPDSFVLAQPEKKNASKA